MKSVALILLLLTALAVRTQAAEPTYRETIQVKRDRFSLLEMKRWEKVSLSQEEEKEWLELSRRLKVENPVSALQRELQEKLERLTRPSGPGGAERERVLSDAEVNQIDILKEFLATVDNYTDPRDSRAEAKEIVAAMRGFIARGDTAGASLWTLKR